MIFPLAANAAEKLDDPLMKPLAKSFAFDYKSKTFRLVDGSPVLSSGADAVAQWLELFVRTVPQRFTVYDGQDFGVDATQLIGKKIVPNGAVISEIKREIEEGALLCPAIRAVYNFKLSGGTISFTVSLDDGEERELSIEL